MILTTIIICLFLDRIVWDVNPYREFAWYKRSIGNTLKRPYASWLKEEKPGILVFFLPPFIVIAWLQGIFNDSWGFIPELIFNCGILLLSLGPRELGRDTENISKNSQDLCRKTIENKEPGFSLAAAQCILSELNNRLIAPIFWFVVLGPLGAVAYRLIFFLDQVFEDTSLDTPKLKQNARALLYYADWLPSRFCAASYAISGNFEAVSIAWKQMPILPTEERHLSAKHLLIETGTAALDSYPDQDEIPALCSTPPVIEDALALAWRSLTFWLGMIATGTLFSALTG